MFKQNHHFNPNPNPTSLPPFPHWAAAASSAYCFVAAA
jgi:hypothetical protein